MDNRGVQKHQQKPRKRARTFGDPIPPNGNGAWSGGKGRTTPPPTSRYSGEKRTSQGFHHGIEEQTPGDAGIGDEDVEWYEDYDEDMSGFGWSQVWRRSDEEAEAGSGGRLGDDRDGLDGSSRAMARKVGLAWGVHVVETVWVCGKICRCAFTVTVLVFGASVSRNCVYPKFWRAH